MKTALIIGITGGFGGYVAQALASQGWQLRALMRNPAKLHKRFNNIDIIQGNASNIDDVRRAANKVDLVVYAVSPANYDWDNKALPWLDVTATVAEEQGLTIIFPANVYVFNPEDGPDFNESSAIAPINSKGNIRQAMEARLKDASAQGAKVIIIRCGDFIGQHASSTWIQQLIKVSNKNVLLTTTGPTDISHSWAYLPDVANTVAAITNRLASLPAYNLFHFEGHRFNFNELSQSLNELTGKKVIMKNFSWLVIRLLSPFSKLLHGLIEMRYLWQTEINLDGTKLKQMLGQDYKATPLSEILLESNLLK